MLREVFLGRRPSHFKIDNTVKAFIVSESFFWSAWNFIMPIFAIFVVRNILGGTIEIAASAYSVHLIARIVFELISGRFLSTSVEVKKYLLTILGMLCISLAYLGFIFTTTITFLYLFYALAGIGFGIASPAKFSLFSTHIDKDKGAIEWGIYDAIALIGMALAASLGGFIVKAYGFKILFVIAALVNLLGMIPYLLFINSQKSPKV